MMMMASPCVDSIGMSPENFLDCPTYSSYGWLSPRISFSRDFVEEGTTIASGKLAQSPEMLPEKPDHEDPNKDFEFCLEHPVAMLPADELFYDGKLVPLQVATTRPTNDPTTLAGIRVPVTAKSCRRIDISGADFYSFSPKAPRCSSRWRELLGLKKVQNPKPVLQKSSLPSKNPKSLKHFLRGGLESKSSIDSSLSLPLLRDSEEQSVSTSSRLSLSSTSSSGPDHEDLPRFSLDSDKASVPPLVNKAPPRVKVTKHRTLERPSTDNLKPFLDHPRRRVGRSLMRRAPDSGLPVRGVSVDSPRMNSSGKIVFQSLERSSSSPSSFNGGSRNGKDFHYRHRENWRGMERSYSANVRVTPVLNVPVCSLRASSKAGGGGSRGAIFGLGQLFSPQKNLKPNRARNDRL